MKCPKCTRSAFLLCGGACYEDHVHDVACIYCGQHWQANTVVAELACTECGKLGQTTADDPCPALCPQCYALHLRRITVHLVVVADARGEEVAREWLRERLIQDSHVPPDWADILSNDIYANRYKTLYTGPKGKMP